MSDTPRTDEVPTEESRIKRLREWAHRALLRQPCASIIERTIAEDVQHLEVKYQRENATLREQLAERDAEIAALKGHAKAIAHDYFMSWAGDLTLDEFNEYPVIAAFRAGMRCAADIAFSLAIKSDKVYTAGDVRASILANADK